VQELVDGVLTNVGRLNTLNTFFTALGNSTTPLGNAFADLKLHFMILGQNSDGVVTKMGMLKAVFTKILIPIALIGAAIAGLILWWQDLGERNAELRDRFLVIWENIQNSFN